MWLQIGPSDYPDQLTKPQPYRRRLAWRPWLLLGLVILCFIPRAYMTQRVTVVCPDGTQYIERAQALSNGDWAQALHHFRLNPYFVAMAGLHHLGLDWEQAGQWWNVAMATLVVLPLFGWVRRQFDDRLAIVACVLYAFHARLIIWSPEIIRDPTFWLLLMLTIYLSWRAITEVRPVLFVAAGVSGSVMLLTRFEGVFLIVPLMLWFGWRWFALRQGRLRLALGLLLIVVALPCLLLVANHLWFGLASPWNLMRTSHVGMVGHWLGSLGDATVDSGRYKPPISVGSLFWIYVKSVGQGLTIIQGLLLLVGICFSRSLITRRDHRSILYFNLSILTAMALSLHLGHATTTRYALPVMLTGFPFAAIGLLTITEAAGRCVADRRWRRAAWAAPIVVVVIIGIVHPLRDRYECREMCTELGHWTRQEFGQNLLVGGDAGLGRVSAYYAEARFLSLDLPRLTIPYLVDVARKNQPDVVLLSSRSVSQARWQKMLDEMKRIGYEPVSPSRLPTRLRKTLVLTRGRPDRLATRLPRPTPTAQSCRADD